MNTPFAPPQRTVVSQGVPAYLPMMVLLAFGAFLLTGFGTGLKELQPIPVYLFICLALLTMQEHIAENRSLAHRAYVFLASSFAVLYAGEFVFAIRPFDFAHQPITYVIAEAVLLTIFLVDTFARHRRLTVPSTASERFGRLAIDAAATGVFFYGSAFLMDLLGGQVVLHHVGLQFGKPYVVVDLNALFHLHLASPANFLEGLNLILALAATAVALALLTMAGVVLPSTSQDVAHTDGMHSFWQIMRDGVVQVVASLRLVIGPLIWLIPAFSIAAFADYVTRYFNASARLKSTIFDLFNPVSQTSRANVGLGLWTLLLGVMAVAAMIVAVAVLEENGSLISHTLITFRDAARSVALTWALFIYSLAATNAVVILLDITKAAPFQVGAPGLLALMIGSGFLAYESTQVARVESRQQGRVQPGNLRRTGPLIDRGTQPAPRRPVQSPPAPV